MSSRIQTSSRAGDVLGRALQLLGRQLQAQFAQAQSALVEVLAEWLEKRPVFGKGAQDALRFDHRMVADWQIKAAIVLHRRARFTLDGLAVSINSGGK